MPAPAPRAGLKALLSSSSSLLFLTAVVMFLATGGVDAFFFGRMPARLMKANNKPQLAHFGTSDKLSLNPARFGLPRPLKAATLTPGGDELDSAAALKNDGLKIELRQFSKFLQSTAWFSWWAQVICNTVAACILFFTNSFVQPAGATRNIFSNGYIFAAGGLCLGAISIFWTWGYTGVAKRIRRAVLEPPTSLAMIRRVVRTAIFVNLLGLLTSLIGAEQFVGNLMARVLSQQGFAPLMVQSAPGAGPIASPTVQPVDIFVIQANTNILLSHFISLVCSLVLLLRYSKISRGAGESN